jgi:hypothetical protein
MKFPPYVPAAVRDFVDGCLEGNDVQEGLNVRLAHAKGQLAVIDIASESGSSAFAAELQHQYRLWLLERRTGAVEEVKRLSKVVECLTRLGTDPRMCDAFSFLSQEVSDDKQWRALVHAAWAADCDYGRLRDESKAATALGLRIATASRNLADLLSKFGKLRLLRSGDQFAIADLLLATEPDDREAAQKWRLFREAALGRPVQGAIDTDARNSAQRDGWRSAPSLHLILHRAAAVAEKCEPDAAEFIRAAIDTRQRNRTTAYVRAFASLLEEYGGFSMTRSMKKAIAVVATVVINENNTDVTYDDVRKALARRGRPSLENSSLKERPSVPERRKASRAD